MKILIVTMWDNANIGNRLQNYALQQVLKKIGCDVRTAVVDQHPIRFRSKCKMLIKRMLALIGIKKFKISVMEYDNRRCERVEREKTGKKFSDEYISGIEYIGRFKDAFKKDLSSYDYVIAGSDQIWHKWYGSDEYEIPYYGLTFMPRDRRIAYAGSFGFDQLPEDRIEQYTTILNGYASISVREDVGAKIIEELTGRKAEIVLDPTLMLTSDEWKQIETLPEYFVNRSYALVYSLGKKEEIFRDTIEDYKNDGLDVIEIRGEKRYGNEQDATPSEFVYLIHHADIILTDSFHATAFSLLFHKKMIVFQREGQDMSSRIISLAKTVGLKPAMRDDGILFSVGSDTDFSAMDLILGAEREKSIGFILKSIMKTGGAKPYLAKSDRHYKWPLHASIYDHQEAAA